MKKGVKAAATSLTIPRRVVVAVALVPAGASLLIDAPVPWATRALDVLLWVLCLVPAYVYFNTPRDRRRPLPFLPVVSFIYGVYYALPLALGSVDKFGLNMISAPVDPKWDYELPVELAFFGWIAMIVSYSVLGMFIREPPPATFRERDPATLAWWALGLLYGGITVILLRSYLGGVLTSGGTYQFLISLEWLGAGLLVILARRRQLPILMRIAALIGTIVAALLMLAIGSIAPLVMLIAVMGFGLWIGRPVIQTGWIVTGFAVLLFAVTLRGVVADFRKTAWFGNETMTPAARIGLMLTLLQNKVDNEGVAATVSHGIATTASRSATMDLFANVVRRTPSEIPYWNGATYVSLIGSFIPRLLWPDKPTKELGQAFGHRYGYIMWSNTGTAVNFPILVEFYANFAITGVILGMILVGMIYRILDASVNRPGQPVLASMIGAVLLLPLLLIESDFSLVFGGIPLNAAAMYVVWLVIGRGSRGGDATKAFRRLRPQVMLKTHEAT